MITRRTTVAFRQRSVALTVIPSSFDLAAFEEFARRWTGGTIARWTDPPALIIDSALVESPAPRNNATAGRLGDEAATTLVRELSHALPPLTGSTFTAFSSVTRRATPAGQAIPMYVPGAITVVYYVDDDGTCGQAGPSVSQSTLRIVAAAIWLKLGCASARTIAHELGHALGYGHVNATPSVMRPDGRVNITAFDRAAAIIVFRRPPGNRAPDTDPEPSSDASTLALTDRHVTLRPLP